MRVLRRESRLWLQMHQIRVCHFPIPIAPSKYSISQSAHCVISVKATVSEETKAVAVTAWCVEDAIRVITRGIRETSTAKSTQQYIHKLTKEQCKAVINGLAKQNDDLEDQNHELRDHARENAIPSIRRSFTLQQIHENYVKKQQALEEQQAEVSLPYTMQA